MLTYASLASGLETVETGAPPECSSLVLCAASVLGLSLSLSDFGLSLSASSNCGTYDTERGWRARLDLCAASVFSLTPPYADVGCIPVPESEEGALSRSSGCAMWFRFRFRFSEYLLDS